MTIYSNPESWGPPAWVFLHCITLTYPIKPNVREKEIYHSFFSLVGEVLPCPSCRREYKKWMEKHPIQLNSREELSRWLIELHNNVNLRKKKDKIESINKALQNIKKECREYQNLSKK